MAWTWSAQGWGNYAVSPDVAAALNRLQRSLPRPEHCGPLAAAAAALTLSGLAIPLMPVESASTLLFIGGALVALLALRPPVASAQEIQIQLPRAAAIERSVPSVCRAHDRFAELIDGADRASAMDRHAWARLTAHMSHELRTPLNAVLGFSELMSKEVFGPMGASCYGDYARGIHASGRMLLKSAEDALAITALLTAAPVKGALPTSSLSASIEDALAFHAATIADRTIDIATCFAADDLIVADAQTVRQLLINLVAEALDRAPTGLHLAISTTASDGQLRFTIGLGANTAAGPDPASSFNMQLARTLADLSGAQIDDGVLPDHSAVLSAAFTPAAQRDFFASA
ncbi:MAG: sensor histidine kinase [Hyphomicrobium sp.]